MCVCTWQPTEAPNRFPTIFLGGSFQVGATFLVRDMVNMPTECMGPAQIQRVAELLAARFGGKASAVVGEDLLKVRDVLRVLADS